MRVRERRSWTKEEDNMLRAAIKLEEPHTDRPSKWHSIARHVPGRTNKDCRKRWCATMASIVSKGGWSSEEDRKLLDAVEKHGTKWSVVASLVETRNSGQCAKRWQDTLNPAIDRSAWSVEEDAKLLDAVENMGTCWTTIVKSYFPGRTALAAKNRYSHLNRSSSSKRSSSPSGSTASLTPNEDPPSPMDLQENLPTDIDQALAIDTSLSSPTTSPAPSPVDPNEIVTDIPGSPDSLSSDGPPTPNVDTFDGKLLESLLQDLSPHTDLSDFKPSEFSFSFGSEATTIANAQTALSFDAPNLPCLSSPAFAALSDQFSSWYQLDDLDVTSLETPGIQTMPDVSLNNLPVSPCLQPDQQVAVAVAICRADNLRPTVQVLIQSLAGALTQPSTSFPLTAPLTKT
ncbi:hypothetical protein BDM02DRAFT_2212669 [Thelephora ganbajun]|uniref:Uncharacterized protein n=1 Tax=Thelephora ganbajun TaxID=370292 RepID=A0ACB6ZG97_THEGA|nr:hypothetical protein BDM02DRAFT_2212669 [Thelephora ganbajun]